MGRAALGGATLVVLVGVSACSAGWIEDGVFYSRKGYRLALPGKAWRASVTGRADLELARSDPAAGILVHATCEGKAPGRPLGVLARHLTFGLAARAVGEQSEVSVGGRTGVRMRLEGRLDGAPVAVEAFVVKGEQCVYDLVYVAAPADFDAARAEFRALVRSFAFTRGE